MAICRKPKIGRNRRAGVIPLSGEMSRSDKRVRDSENLLPPYEEQILSLPLPPCGGIPLVRGGNAQPEVSTNLFLPLMREVARALRVTEGETVGRGLAPAVGNGSTKPFLVYPKNFCPCSPGRTKSVYLRREQAPALQI